MTYDSEGRYPSQPASRRKKRKKDSFSVPKIIVAVLIVIAVIALIVLGVKLIKDKSESSAVEAETLEPEPALEKDVRVDGVSISNLGKTQAKIAIEKKYNWSMKAKLRGGQPDSYEIANLLDKSIEKTLDMIYSTSEPEENYTINFEMDEEGLDREIENMKALWNKEAKNGSISGFNKETEQFEYSGEEKGIALDEEKLRNDIRTAFSAKKFDSSIDVSTQEVEPELSEEKAKALYKTIGTYTTKSTNNADRNNNLNLACNAIDGVVLQVGEEFSFNLTTGNRTAEKGYKEAAAYQNGEVVSEPGGGVCQVASTLYNAVIFSGIEVTERHPHTYAPTYVTPGEDATVSYDGYSGPDLRFTNTSSSTIVIRAHYEDRTVNCWIIGIPILAEGEKISMHSEKIAESEVPPPAYEDDPTMAPGVQVVASKGDKGSTWNTYLKHEYPDGRVTDELFHVSKYKGHTPKIKRNQSAWDPAFDTIPTDASGNTVQFETHVDENGQITVSYPDQTQPEDNSETTAPGPGQSETEKHTEPQPSPGGDGGPGEESPQHRPTVPDGPGPGDSPSPGDIPLVPAMPGQ